MLLVRLLLNLLTVAVELALIGAACWLAWRQPVIFAGVTTLLALVLGLALEPLRLAHEAPFYFIEPGRFGRLWRWLVGSGQALVRALAAGVVALITFAGTDATRMSWLAALLGAVVFVGSSLLRRLAISFGARPARWGYFRMALPLGLAFSLGLSFLPVPGIGDIVWSAVIDLPQRPSLAKAGEALFNIRQWIDDLIVRALLVFVGPDAARLAGIVLSTNVLAGFVASVYAVAVSEVVRVMEQANWRLTRPGTATRT